jgi:hypothetical protein
MLCVHLMQNWLALNASAMEEALYEGRSLRNFAKLKVSEPIPRQEVKRGRIGDSTNIAAPSSTGASDDQIASRTGLVSSSNKKAPALPGLL